jgi:hypothetical protein
MTPLRQRMLEDMHLHGLSPATQRSYLRAITCLAPDYPPLCHHRLQLYCLGCHRLWHPTVRVYRSP